MGKGSHNNRLLFRMLWQIESADQRDQILFCLNASGRQNVTLLLIADSRCYDTTYGVFSFGVNMIEFWLIAWSDWASLNPRHLLATGTRKFSSSSVHVPTQFNQGIPDWMLFELVLINLSICRWQYNVDIHDGVAYCNLYRTLNRSRQPSRVPTSSNCTGHGAAMKKKKEDHHRFIAVFDCCMRLSAACANSFSFIIAAH
jgi:hypothetical protein